MFHVRDKSFHLLLTSALNFRYLFLDSRLLKYVLLIRNSWIKMHTRMSLRFNWLQVRIIFIPLIVRRRSCQASSLMVSFAIFMMNFFIYKLFIKFKRLHWIFCIAGKSFHHLEYIAGCITCGIIFNLLLLIMIFILSVFSTIHDFLLLGVFDFLIFILVIQHRLSFSFSIDAPTLSLHNFFQFFIRVWT